MTIEIQEYWLRDHRCDLHLIERETYVTGVHFEDRKYVCELAPNKLPVCLDTWLRRELPETPIGIVYPHSSSDPKSFDWLVPYVDFNTEGVIRYCTEWEGADQTALKVGFKLTRVDYAKWLADLSQYEIFNSPCTMPTALWWCATPVGMLWCKQNIKSDIDIRMPADVNRNLWIRSQEQYQKLKNINLDDVVTGILTRNFVENDGWFIGVIGRSSREIAFGEAYHGGYGLRRPLRPEERTIRQQAVCTFLGVGQQLVKFR